ncbi:hypothetical protein [Streptomyces sp. NPDC000410]|uniref:hypothetical protein n=1 Tax=Streptomyces sp. NPDC000410 TaxID=3154254 RepID=UPI00332714C7
MFDKIPQVNSRGVFVRILTALALALTSLVGVTLMASPAQAQACTTPHYTCLHSLPNTNGSLDIVYGWDDQCLVGDTWAGTIPAEGMNDDIGSIQNNDSRYLHYFEHCNYGGAADFVWAKTYANFQSNYWNNRISSFRFGW